MKVKIGKNIFELKTPPIPQREEAMKVALGQAKKERRKLLRKLKAAKTQSQRKKAQHAYTTSQRVRFATMVEVNRRKFSKTSLSDKIDSFKKSLDFELYLPIEESMQLRLKSKGMTGKFRYYIDFELRHRTAQQMVLDMLKTAFKPKAWQYGISGARGRDEAVKSAKKFIEQGFVNAKHLDIQKFYDSFSHQGILDSDLPLPISVIEHVVIGKHFEISISQELLESSHGALYCEYADLVSAAGIPQGSATSPLVGGYFISKLDMKLSGTLRIINYADDFLVLANSTSALSSAERALKSAVEDLPAGAFRLIEKSKFFPSQEYPPELNLTAICEFLGYKFCVSFPSSQDLAESAVSLPQCTIKVSDLNAVKADNRLIEISKRLSTNRATEDNFDVIVDLAFYILCWEQSFALADDAKDLAESFKAYVAKALDEYPYWTEEEIWTKAQKKRLVEVDWGGETSS